MGTNAELFSAALDGDDLSKFDMPASDVFSDDDIGEAEGLLETVAADAGKPKEEAPKQEVAPAAPVKADDEPPAWFKAWLGTQPKPAEAAPKVEEAKPAPTPEEVLAKLVSNPAEAISAEARRVAEEMMAPLRQQYRTAVVSASQARAISEHGKDAMAAADAALKAAVESGRMSKAQVEAALHGSDDPYGDVFRWHQQEQQRARLDAMAKDPDGFLLQQLAEAAKDPAKREKIMAAFGTASTTPAATPSEGGNVTEFSRRDEKSGRFLPSLNRAASAADDDGEPSDPGGMFKAALRGPRR